ncbi:hypothetical protein PENSPDRAFT_602671 [Peniophora sp. CONT]|nr:hypothetical protein PENSPDRAFT_602671 [Peniophora sp. CONT]
MLSAVAARKLKQGQQDPAAPSPTTVQPAAPIPSILNGSPSKQHASSSKKTNNKPSSKRKPSGHPAPKSASKKPRRSRSKGKDKATPRYFAEPVHADASDDDAVISVDEDEEDEREGMLVGPNTDPLPSSTKRAYSPSRPVEEDSSDDDVPAPSAPLRLKSVQRQPAPVTVSTFEPSLDQNMFVLTADERSILALGDENAIVLLLSAQETFSFIGTSRLHVLRGSVVMHGTTLRASNISHPVFAPRSSPVPSLQAITTPDGSSEQASVALPSRIKRLSKGAAAIVALREMFTGVEGLGHVVRTFDGVFRPSLDDSVLELPLVGAAMCVRSSRDIQPFVMPSSWEDALQEVTSAEGSGAPPVYFVKGPKNSGKSTLARTMVNRLTARYRRVAYLDCDIGQSEFTPGGMVALTVVERPLFGPPFTHMTVPYQAHYLGSSSPRSSPSHYLSCIEALLHAYRIDLQYGAVVDVDDDAEDGRIPESIPLVVNTMGWAKGLGADLTLKIEHLAAPSAVFSFYPDPPPEEYDGPPLHLLDPIAPPTHVPRYTAADHRALALLSYFHSIFPSSDRTVAQRTAEKWDTRLPLCATPPYELDMRATIQNVVLAGAGMEDVVPTEILRVLNGALVGLVKSDDDGAPYTSEGWALPYSQAAPPPDPTASHCTALAVIRAVSPDGSKIHLLTPLPSSANTFVKGELEIPVWGMLDFRDGGAGEETGLPFLRWGKAGADGAIGGERRRIRRNLMRKGQM